MKDQEPKTTVLLLVNILLKDETKWPTVKCILDKVKLQSKTTYSPDPLVAFTVNGKEYPSLNTSNKYLALPKYLTSSSSILTSVTCERKAVTSQKEEEGKTVSSMNQR